MAKPLTNIQDTIHSTNCAINKIKNTLRQFFPEPNFKQLEFELSNVLKHEQNKQEEQLEITHRPIHAKFDQSAIHNISNIEIPIDILMALSWGRKFLFPYNLNNQKMIAYMAELEYTLDNAVPIETKTYAAKEIRKELNKATTIEHDPTIQWLNFLEYRIRSFLKTNSTIRIIDSDKGACTIITDLNTYNMEIDIFTSDTSVFTPLTINPIQTTIQLETQFVTWLKSNKKTKHLVGTFEPNTLTAAKFYATEKHHKNTRAIRPIISTVGSPGYTLGKAFNTILTNVFPPPNRHIRAIKTFKHDIDSLTIEEDDRMVSFDIVSMYTNIPPDLVIQIITKKAHIFKEMYDIPPNMLLKMLAFLLKEINFFETNQEKLFLMKNGLPMGGPISAIAARLVIDEILDWAFKQTKIPKFHRVYVDDSLFILKHNEIKDLLLTLNSYNKNIKFTSEYEVDNSINFLNLTLIRQNNHIITNWYRKIYASKRLLNYFSSHKRSTILNTATQFIKTIIELSDATFFQANKDKAINMLELNNFPETLIITLMNNHYTLMKPTQIRNPKNTLNRYVSFPHTIRNKAIKTIIRDYAHPNTTLAESVKNTKVNFTQKIKKNNTLEQRGNVIATSTCECKSRVAIKTAKYNENGKALINRMVTKNDQCTTYSHCFQKVKLHNGLYYKGQTAYLAKQLAWKHRSKLTDFQDFPTRYLRQ